MIVGCFFPSQFTRTSHLLTFDSYAPLMNCSEAIRIALQSLWASKPRPALTLLGVVIGGQMPIGQKLWGRARALPFVILMRKLELICVIQRSSPWLRDSVVKPWYTLPSAFEKWNRGGEKCGQLSPGLVICFTYFRRARGAQSD